MDTEVFSINALETAYNKAGTNSEKEHVTPYLYTNPKQFNLISITDSPNFGNIRLTVDTEEDFILIKKIIESLYPINKSFTYRDILNLLNKYKNWVKINNNVKQKGI